MAIGNFSKGMVVTDTQYLPFDKYIDVYGLRMFTFFS